MSDRSTSKARTTSNRCASVPHAPRVPCSPGVPSGAPPAPRASSGDSARPVCRGLSVPRRACLSACPEAGPTPSSDSKRPARYACVPPSSSDLARENTCGKAWVSTLHWEWRRHNEFAQELKCAKRLYKHFLRDRRTPPGERRPRGSCQRALRGLLPVRGHLTAVRALQPPLESSRHCR